MTKSTAKATAIKILISELDIIDLYDVYHYTNKFFKEYEKDKFSTLSQEEARLLIMNLKGDDRFSIGYKGSPLSVMASGGNPYPPIITGSSNIGAFADRDNIL